MDNINCSLINCNINNQRILNEWKKYSLSDNEISIINSNSNDMVLII